MSHLRGVRCVSSSRTCLRPGFSREVAGAGFPGGGWISPKQERGVETRPQTVDWLRVQLDPGEGHTRRGGAGHGRGRRPSLVLPSAGSAEPGGAGRSRAGGGSSVGRRVCPGRAQPGVAHTPRCRVNRPAPGPSPRWRNDHSRRGRERTGLPQHCRCPGAGWPRLRTGGAGRPWPPRRSYLSTSLGEQGRAAVGVPAHTRVVLRTRVVPHTRVLHMRPSVCPWHRSWGWGLEGEM